jgi:polyhydroxyalkanoate synthesis regulator phasin
MPPEIDTLATMVGALIKILVKKGALTPDEARDILTEAEKVLEPDPHISFRATARQVIERVTKVLTLSF